MGFVLTEIAKGKTNSEVHDAFIKFSKGLFTQKYMINAKKGKDGWAIKTGPEYVNSLVHSCLEKVNGNVDVTGVIVATFDVSQQAGFPTGGIKQFMGIKQAIVNTNVDSKKILDLMKRQPRAFYALSFAFPGGSLKVKAKAPKSAKPAASGDKEAVADFCTLKTNDDHMVKEMMFDVPEGKVIAIKHDININDIEIPKNVKDPVQMREQSVRKGKIVRYVDVDGNKSKKEYNFSA